MMYSLFANETDPRLNYTIMAIDTSNKQKLVELIKKIDQKQKELKKLKED